MQSNDAQMLLIRRGPSITRVDRRQALKKPPQAGRQTANGAFGASEDDKCLPRLAVHGNASMVNRAS